MNCCNNDTFTNVKGCYSNLKAYGSNCMVQPIMNPYPATICPKVYNINNFTRKPCVKLLKNKYIYYY